MPIFPRNPNKIIKRIVAAGFSLSLFLSFSFSLLSSSPFSICWWPGGRAGRARAPGEGREREERKREKEREGMAPLRGRGWVGESEKERKFYL